MQATTLTEHETTLPQFSKEEPPSFFETRGARPGAALCRGVGVQHRDHLPHFFQAACGFSRSGNNLPLCGPVPLRPSKKINETRERSVCGETEAEPTYVEDGIDNAKGQIKAWMEHYYKHRWENQPLYVEVWVEKKALQGVFERPCATCKHLDEPFIKCCECLLSESYPNYEEVVV